MMLDGSLPQSVTAVDDQRGPRHVAGSALILDEDGLYEPAHFNDRLLLGLKGTMSEAELHVLRARLQGGYLAKARRGELRIRLPVGFVYDEADQVRLDPDRQVQDAVRLLLSTFDRTGSASATFRAFHAQGLRFPCRPPHGPHQGELVWQALTYSRALDVLHNPRYAGAYVLGRTRQRKLANGRRLTRALPRDKCQEMLGLSIDEAVSQLVVEAVTPMALKVTMSVQEELKARFEEADHLRREQVERARYEADAARRRYVRVDPDNRLVADSLEAEWNDKLRALNQAQEEYERQRQADEALLSTEERQRIADLATDFPALWQASSTGDKDRKRMLRLLIEDVTLLKGDEALAVHVRFRGGDTRSLSLPRPAPSWKTWLTPPETVDEIDRLLEDHTDAQIAHQLNESGFRSGKGRPFQRQRVRHIRCQYGLKSRYQRLRERGLITADEVLQLAGITRQTLHRWRREGRIQAETYNDKPEYLYDPTAGIPRKNDPPRGNNTEEERVNQHHGTKEVQYEL